MDFLHDSTAPSPSVSFDSTACVALAERHVPRMLQVARSILGCEDLAWDAVQDALIAAGFSIENAQVDMVPSNTVAVAGDDARKLLVLIDALEELDDVQNVYSNADLPDDEE